MESEFITVEVRLRRVTKEAGQAAVDAIESILNEHELPDDVRLALWDHYKTLASDVLIRFREFDPDVGYPEGNGHA